MTSSERQDNSTSRRQVQPGAGQQSFEPTRRGPRWLDTVLQDVRFAVRALRKTPGFTVTAILTLALGIGANTAIFQLLDTVRLRSLPVSDPGALATVRVKGGLQRFGVSSNDSSLSYALWERIRSQQEGFSGIFAWVATQVPFGEGERQRLAQNLWVAGDVFPTLGVVPYRGRFFTSEENRFGCGTPGVVISYGLWKSEFGGRDSAIGSKIVVASSSIEVIGVTPPSFFGLEVGKQFEIVLPFCSRTTLYREDTTLTRADYFWITVTGHLKPGWSLQRASAQLDTISPGIFEATVPPGYGTTALDKYRSFRLAAYPFGNGASSLQQRYDTSLWLLLGITGMVLLIACANLANLMLVRASAREKEMAVRLAIGASRARIIQQLLLEGLVLSVTGCLLGTCLAPLFSGTVVRFLSTERDQLQLALTMDWRILTFAVLMAIATCVAFGLAPALRSSRTEPGAVLKSGGRGMTGGRKRFSFQRMLVVSQIAFSVVLLVGALLFVRSFWNLMTLDPGFTESGILLTQVTFRTPSIPPEHYRAFKHDLVQQIRSIPLVDAAASSTHIPLNNSYWSLGIRIGNAENESRFTWVSPGYFETMRIPLLFGRNFDERDTITSPHVAIVNETFVRLFLGGANPIGKTFRSVAEQNFPEAEYEIVGVVKDTKYSDLREAVPPLSYGPDAQYPWNWYWTAVFVRSSAPPPQLISAVREKITSIYPDVKVQYDMFQTNIQEGLVRERMMAVLSGFFGVLAALLAMIGLYGVISYIIAMRRNEIGIRMALGATQDNVIGIVLRQTLGLLALGVGIGLLFAVVVTRGARALLFGLGPNDPISLIGAALFLAGVALVASLWPAYRATRVDPMKALRYE
ncbi:MAG TPA: ABC transporter permease [Candidatus Acidoferrum sp.]|nr:ABC transporter permease [Candidatus Acidoferrum sp.]